MHLQEIESISPQAETAESLPQEAAAEIEDKERSMKRQSLVFVTLFTILLIGLAVMSAGWFSSSSSRVTWPQHGQSPKPTKATTSSYSEAAWRWRTCQPAHWRTCLLQR